MPDSFFDTNVLLYLASSDVTKADRAETLVNAGGVISVQVLNEVTNVARRKMRMTWPEIHPFLSTIRSLLTVRANTVETHEQGLEFAERYNISTYDAMIVASAVEACCDTLWSEDMHDGLIIGGVLRIRNPFPTSGR